MAKKQTLAKQVEQVEQVEQAEQVEQVEQVEQYRVAEGKAINTRKGIIVSGAEIKAEYLSGGQDALAALVASGSVVVK